METTETPQTHPRLKQCVLLSAPPASHGPRANLPSETCSHSPPPPPTRHSGACSLSTPCGADFPRPAVDQVSLPTLTSAAFPVPASTAGGLGRSLPEGFSMLTGHTPKVLTREAAGSAFVEKSVSHSRHWARVHLRPSSWKLFLGTWENANSSTTGPFISEAMLLGFWPFKPHFNGRPCLSVLESQVESREWGCWARLWFLFGFIYILR